ncbi:MAG: XRE family transcriptional regulator [Actinobacteria bacterium]|nr:XRE family transcriptional regulator [Actinomycetota bacterium]
MRYIGVGWLAAGTSRSCVPPSNRILAGALGVSQANVSRVEREGDVYLSTLRNYVSALGGKLELRAVFPDEGGRVVPIRRSKEGETMAGSRKTGAKAAKAASKVLRDGRTGKSSKSAAGSALSQRAPKRSSKKK